MPRRTPRPTRARRRPAAFVALLLALAGAAAPFRAATAASGSLDPRELAAFFDGLLAGLMSERHVPGAVVLVVKDGAVLFAKGYGVADLETGRAVDPETTLFRVASVSKLFTATAAMQLVEQGRLELGADVNRYLGDFRIPDAFGRPVTLENLLTHTGGFDDVFLRSTQPLSVPRVPLGRYLAAHMPPRVMPPAELISYSNHGLALAGHLVERASGQAFDAYVKEHLLDPLGMTRSGFGLPESPPPELAIGAVWRDGRYAPAGVDRILQAPAGDLATTALDISRFMLAHLEGGALGGARILRAETVREMMRPRFRNHPELAGWCLGWSEERRVGRGAVGHAGSWRGFGTELVLVPESRLGLFVSTTRDYDGRFFDPLLAAFSARILGAPESDAAPEPHADFAERAAEYEGTYIPNRRVRGDFMKMGVARGTARVESDGEGALVLRPGGDADPVRLVETGPDLFVEVTPGDARRRVFFRRDAHDRIEHLFLDAWSFDRVPWWRSPRLHAALAVGCFALFAATALGLTLAALVRRVAGGPPSSVPALARAVAAAFAGLAAFFLAALAIAFESVSPYVLFEGVPGWLTALSALALCAVALSLVLPVLLARGRSWTPLARLHFALLCAAALVFALLLWTYNFLGVLR